MLFAVFGGGNASLFFEYLAKIGGGIKAALHGNASHVVAALLHHIAGLGDLDGI